MPLQPMNDIDWLRVAIGLMRSVTSEERSNQIYGKYNDQLTALAVAIYNAAQVGDPNAIRTVLDTAFCLGIRSEKLRNP